jgi:hypothetical protein
MTWTFTPLTLVSAVILASIWVSNFLFLRRLEQSQTMRLKINESELPYLSEAQQDYERGFE